MFNIKALKENKYTGTFTKRSVENSNDRIKAETITEKGVKKYVLTVKFADYNSIDDSRDKMVRGCFDKSWEKSQTSARKIVFLWQHDRKDPIGRVTDLWDDEKGAYVRIELSDFDAVPNAKRTWYQVLDGVLNQASFGYRYVWDATKYVGGEHGEEGYFLVGEVILREVSIVTFGENENTEVQSATEVVESELMKSLLETDNVKEALIRTGDKNVLGILAAFGIANSVEQPTPQRRGLFGR